MWQLLLLFQFPQFYCEHIYLGHCYLSRENLLTSVFFHYPFFQIHYALLHNSVKEKVMAGLYTPVCFHRISSKKYLLCRGGEGVVKMYAEFWSFKHLNPIKCLFVRNFVSDMSLLRSPGRDDSTLLLSHPQEQFLYKTDQAQFRYLVDLRPTALCTGIKKMWKTMFRSTTWWYWLIIVTPLVLESILAVLYP